MAERIAQARTRRRVGKRGIALLATPQDNVVHEAVIKPETLVCVAIFGSLLSMMVGCRSDEKALMRKHDRKAPVPVSVPTKPTMATWTATMPIAQTTPPVKAR